MTWPRLAKNQALNEFVRAHLTPVIVLATHLLLFRVFQGCCKASVLQSVAWGHLSLLSDPSCYSFPWKNILVWFMPQCKNENSAFLKLPLKTQSTLNTCRLHSSDWPISTTKISDILQFFSPPLFSLFLLQYLPLKIDVTLQVPGFKINWLYTEKVTYFSKMQTLDLFPHGSEPGRELSPQSFVYLWLSLHLSQPWVPERGKSRETETVNYCKTTLSSQLLGKHCIGKCLLGLSLSAFTMQSLKQLHRYHNKATIPA